MTDFGSDLPRLACPHCYSDRVARMGIPNGDPHVRCLRCWQVSDVDQASKAKHHATHYESLCRFPIGVQRLGLPEEVKPAGKTAEQQMAIEATTKRLTEALEEKLKLDRYITIQEVCDLAGYKQLIEILDKLAQIYSFLIFRFNPRTSSLSTSDLVLSSCLQ